MAGNLVKEVMLKIVGSSGDAEAKLKAIDAKADELARKHPELKVKVDTAQASAKLALLRKELKDTGSEADKTRFSIRNFGTALASVASGGMSGGISEMSLMQKVMLGLNVATGLGEPLMAGLLVTLGGLTAGLASASAGAGIFGAVVKSTFSGISKNITAAATAEEKMAGARTMAGMTKDTQAFNLALKDLDPAQKQLVVASANAEAGWHQFVKSAGGGVNSVLIPALKMVPELLQSAHGFLGPVESGLRSIVGSVGHGLQSSGFQSFLKELQGQSGGDLEKLAAAAGHVAVGLGGIIKSFLPYAPRILADVDNLTEKFAKWGTTLSGHSGFQSLMSMFRTETPLAVGVLKNLGGIIKNIVADMTGLSTFSNGRIILQILGPLTGFLNTISKNKALLNFALYALAAFDGLKKLSNGITGVSNAFTAMKSAGSVLQTVAAKIGLVRAAQVEATEATEGETAAQEELDVAMEANPIGIIILAIGALVIAFKILWDHSAGFRNFWKGLWKDIKAIIGDAISWIAGHWKLILSILTGPVGAAVIFIVSHWHQIVAGAQAMWSAVVGFFKRLPGDILRALGNLGSLLLHAGEAIIDGLLNGLKAAAGGVLSFVSGLAHDISGAFSSVLHMFSPSRVFSRHGQNIVLGLVQGITGSAPLAYAAVNRLASGVAAAGSMSASGGRSGGVMVEINAPTGYGWLPPEFWTALGNGIRTRGGSPGLITRKVKFA